MPTSRESEHYQKGDLGPGVPKRGILPLPKVTKPQVWEFSAHPHHALRAKLHTDIRLGDSATGVAHSFVLPKRTELPGPGESARVIPTYSHSIPYQDYTGPVTSEYGKGRVVPGRRTKADVYHAEPSDEAGTKLRFNLYDKANPEEFSIRRDDRGNWFIHNKTLSRLRRPDLPSSKASYKEINVNEVDPYNSEQVMTPKLDGAHALIDLQAGRAPRVYSYRVGKKSATGLIEHTHKLTALLKDKVPQALDKTVLRGEVIAVNKKGKAFPAETIGGLLNAKVWSSRAEQEDLGAKLLAFPFDVVKYRGRFMGNTPFEDRLKVLQEVEKSIGGLWLPEIATTPKEKVRLLSKIQKGTYPLTREGVVLVDRASSGVPTKAKMTRDFDVFVREIHPAVSGKTGDPHNRAGSVSYSWTEEGPVAGRVGGFPHDMAKDMLSNPDKYVGRAAKVVALKVFEGKDGPGALFQPRFKEWHLDKGDIEKQAMWCGFYAFLQKLARSSVELQPHQARVVERISRGDQPGLVVAHGLGTGKTLTSIAAARALGGLAHAVVPASLKANYLKEIIKHEGDPNSIQIKSLQSLAKQQEQTDVPTLIVDEAHRLRDPESKSYKAMSSVNAGKRLLLTASPFYNRPSDIAPLINLAAGSTVLPVGQKQFEDKFLTSSKVSPGILRRLIGIKPGSEQHINPTTIEELRSSMNRWMDYHPSDKANFPEVVRQTIKVPMSSGQLQVHDTLMRKAPFWVRAKVRAGLPPSKTEAAVMNSFLNAARQASNTTGPYVEDESKAEHPKITRAFGELSSLLRDNPQAKGLVYSNFLGAGIAPYKRLLSSENIPYGEFTGEVSKKEKEELVNRYNAGKIKALLVSSAGGEGLDLKGTRLIQLLEPHWNNEKLRQVEGRGIRYRSHAHLPRKDRTVTVQKFLSTRPEDGLLERYKLKKPGLGTDEYLENISGKKDEINRQLISLLESA